MLEKEVKELIHLYLLDRWTNNKFNQNIKNVLLSKFNKSELNKNVSTIQDELCNDGFLFWKPGDTHVDGTFDMDPIQLDTKGIQYFEELKLKYSNEYNGIHK